MRVGELQKKRWQGRRLKKTPRLHHLPLCCLLSITPSLSLLHLSASVSRFSFFPLVLSVSLSLCYNHLSVMAHRATAPDAPAVASEPHRRIVYTAPGTVFSEAPAAATTAGSAPPTRLPGSLSLCEEVRAKHCDNPANIRASASMDKTLKSCCSDVMARSAGSKRKRKRQAKATSESTQQSYEMRWARGSY